MDKLLDKPQKCPLSASSLYAIAALDLGCSYHQLHPIDSAPRRRPSSELAIERGTRHMGYDGKTGETLLKSVLAPMFANRNLEVMSWVGHNIFGNMDGKVLDDPVNKKSKVTSKDRLLAQILGYPPQTLVTIEYIQSLGDWKTAWDHVHFRGFLGTPMTLQFIWQGCDSLLAAPLVLDLVRFTRTGLAPRRHRRAHVPGVVLQKPAGHRRARFRRAISGARSLGRGDEVTDSSRSRRFDRGNVQQRANPRAIVFRVADDDSGLEQ